MMGTELVHRKEERILGTFLSARTVDKHNSITVYSVTSPSP